MEGALTNTAGTGSCELQLEDAFVEAAGDDTEEVLTVEVGVYYRSPHYPRSCFHHLQPRLYTYT